MKTPALEIYMKRTQRTPRLRTSIFRSNKVSRIWTHKTCSSGKRRGDHLNHKTNRAVNQKNWLWNTLYTITSCVTFGWSPRLSRCDGYQVSQPLQMTNEISHYHEQDDLTKYVMWADFIFINYEYCSSNWWFCHKCFLILNT